MSFSNERVTERGFVLPAVIFTMAILTIVAIAALSGSGDSRMSSHAMKESMQAFYAAEAGANQVLGTWDDSLIASLEGSDSLDLGWQTFPNGARSRSVLYRFDNGGQAIYGLTVTGRGSSELGERAIHMVLSGGGGGPLTLGDCCDAAIVARGVIDINTGWVDGNNTLPRYWSSSRCDGYEDVDVPGIIAKDSSQMEIRDDAIYDGNPPFVEDTSMSDDTFDNYGGMTYDELRASATVSLVKWGSTRSYDWGGDPAAGDFGSKIYGPRYTDDGACDTTHPLNFGAPSGPCADHWPIVLISGDIAFKGDGGYAQGIFVLDVNVDGVGTEFDIEKGDVTLVGIIVGKGCVEFDEGQFFGSIFVDGYVYENPSCDTDDPLFFHSGTGIKWSNCAVQQALAGTGLGQSEGGAITRLADRPFVELLR